MYLKTSFVFLVTLAIAKGIVIDKSTDTRTDQALEISPSSTSYGIKHIIIKGSQHALAATKSFIRFIWKSLVKLARTPVARVAFTSGVRMLANVVFVHLFDCHSKYNFHEHQYCMIQAEQFTDRHYSEERLEWMSNVVQDALADYERYLEYEHSEYSESIQPFDIDERNGKKQIAVEPESEVEGVQNEEDNETISYI